MEGYKNNLYRIMIRSNTFAAMQKPLTPPPTAPSINNERPNVIRTREELDAALEEGLRSGISEDTMETILAKALSRARSG